MADINHVISLGIGTPAAIPEFLTFGLQIGEAIAGMDDITGIVSFTSFAPARKATDLTGVKSFTDHTPKRKFDELL